MIFSHGKSAGTWVFLLLLIYSKTVHSDKEERLILVGLSDRQRLLGCLSGARQ